MDPETLQHLDVAARNLTIARDLLHHVPTELYQPAYEWVIVVSFYSAVRDVNAYLRFVGRPTPRSHAARNRELWSDTRLEVIRDQYLELLNWSRDARYNQPHTAFSGNHAEIAVDHAVTIRDHIRRALHAS